MPIQRAQERKIHFRFLMDVMRAIMGAQSHDGYSLDSVLVLTAVGLGELEGKPFKASKLAQYLGMPRATVQRRLAEIMADGLIIQTPGGHYISNPERINAPELQQVTDAVTRMILDAARDLASLEPPPDEACGVRDTPRSEPPGQDCQGCNPPG